MKLEAALHAELTDLRSQNRYRETHAFGGSDRAHPTDENQQPILAFCSNDYLGLANHPAVITAVNAAVTAAGFGSGASRLVSGESPAHRALENELAAFLCLPAALLFPTGYQANVGVITSLAGAADLIVSDAANHASIIDGCRLSRARVVIFPHGNANAAAQAVATKGTFRRRIIVTESLFSMDGDRAPLRDLATIAANNQAALIVDEAHALGVLGPNGRGLAAESGVTPDALVGTLGKTFGAMGGFVAGSQLLRSLMINHSRSFIFSTALPAAAAAAASASVMISAGSDGQSARTHAYRLAAKLRAGLVNLGIAARGQDLIVPVLIGTERDALTVSTRLREKGILVPAIRPPTVPAGTARLRITLSARHTEDDVDVLLAALRPLLDRTSFAK